MAREKQKPNIEEERSHSVHVFSQTYEGAGGVEKFPDLEPVGRIEICVGTILHSRLFCYHIAERRYGYSNGRVNYRVNVRQGITYIQSTILKKILTGIAKKFTDGGKDEWRFKNMLLDLIVPPICEHLSISHIFNCDVPSYDSLTGDGYRPAQQLKEGVTS